MMEGSVYPSKFGVNMNKNKRRFGFGNITPGPKPNSPAQQTMDRMKAMRSPTPQGMSRADFLRNAGIAVGGLVAGAVGMGNTVRAQGTTTVPPMPIGGPSAPGSFQPPQKIHSSLVKSKPSVQVMNQDGSKRYILEVGPAFDPKDVESLGAKFEWQWPQANMAVVSTFSNTFVSDVAVNGAAYNVTKAVPDMTVVSDLNRKRSFEDVLPSGSSSTTAPVLNQGSPRMVFPTSIFPQSSGGSSASYTVKTVFDIFTQWDLMAVGAAKPINGQNIWQLDDTNNAGSGISIGLVDEGMPSTVTRGVWYELYITIYNSEENMVDYYFVDMVYNDLFKFYNLTQWYYPNTGGWRDENPLEMFPPPDQFEVIPNDPDYPNLPPGIYHNKLYFGFAGLEFAIALNPNFKWYDARNDADGGIVPVFKGKEALNGEQDGYNYYINYYTGGSGYLSQEFIDFNYLNDYGFSNPIAYGASESEKQRLPNPSDITWKPDANNPEFGYINVTVNKNGQTVTEERLAVIIDPDVGGFDTVQYGHGTFMASLICARYDVEDNQGIIPSRRRSIAPKAKVYCYKHDNELSKIMKGWKRCIEDKVLISNNSLYWWVSPNEFSQKYETFTRNSANELSRNGIFVVAAAGNHGLVFDEIHDLPWGNSFYHPAMLPNVLTVAGTAPRGYDSGKASEYVPTPGIPKLNENNLDRPALFEAYGEWIFYDNCPSSCSQCWLWDPSINDYVGYSDCPDSLESCWLYKINEVMSTNFGYAVDVCAPSGGDFWGLIWGNMFDGMFIAAPTGGIVPAFIFGIPNIDGVMYTSDGFVAGTSCSSAITSAIAAIAAEAYQRNNKRGLLPSPARLKQIINKSADDLVGPVTDRVIHYDSNYQVVDDCAFPCDGPGKDAIYGKGRVNVIKAIQEAMK